MSTKLEGNDISIGFTKKKFIEEDCCHEARAVRKFGCIGLLRHIDRMPSRHPVESLLSKFFAHMTTYSVKSTVVSICIVLEYYNDKMHGEYQVNYLF
ncbi:unnamed protein product [Gordionus sp. m RMFG-2023]